MYIKGSLKKTFVTFGGGVKRLVFVTLFKNMFSAFFTYLLADISYSWGDLRGEKYFFPKVLKKGSSIGKYELVFC